MCAVDMRCTYIICHKLSLRRCQQSASETPAATQAKNEQIPSCGQGLHARAGGCRLWMCRASPRHHAQIRVRLAPCSATPTSLVLRPLFTRVGREAACAVNNPHAVVRCGADKELLEASVRCLSVGAHTVCLHNRHSVRGGTTAWPGKPAASASVIYLLVPLSLLASPALSLPVLSPVVSPAGNV